LFQSDEFSTIVKDLIDWHHIPGLAIAIVHDDVIASRAFGKASLAPSQDCTPDTLFPVGSASKSLAEASVALLVNDNENHPHLQSEATMSSLLPDDFVMPGENHSDVTVEGALSRRTGMVPHGWSYLGPSAAQPDDAQSITRNLRNLSVAAPNQIEFIYFKMMYTVTTHLVESVSKLSFSDFLQNYMFQPLSMDSTNLQPERVRAKGLGGRIATGYFWDNAGEDREISWYDCPEPQGAAGIISSASGFV
ncbi:beta-lactamase/transpeptidase-like protein, partial [Ilyonectria destructans]